MSSAEKEGKKFVKENEVFENFAKLTDEQLVDVLVLGEEQARNGKFFNKEKSRKNFEKKPRREDLMNRFKQFFSRKAFCEWNIGEIEASRIPFVLFGIR